MATSYSFLHSTIKSNPFSSIYTSNHRCQSSSTIKVTMSDNRSYWASIEADIKAHLKQAIPTRPPLSVTEPMDQLVFASPWSLAPVLCVASCDLVGGQRNQAIAAASALHLAQAAVFTHEHLLLSDNQKPKPKPKTKAMVHHEFKPNIKLLVGDAFLPLGLEIMARLNEPALENSARNLRVILEITKAVGSEGMVNGQHLENQYRGRSDGGDGGWMMMAHVCEKKEGGLYACGAACGAILGEGSEEEIKKLRNYGFYVGMMHGMVGRSVQDERLLEVLEGFRVLALKELEGFKGKGNLETILDLVGICRSANNLNT